MDPDAARKRKTFRLEIQRAISAGILETGAATFLLLIAVWHFEAGALAKALIVVSGPMGLLFSPGLVALTRARRWTAAQGCALPSWLGCAGFALAALGGKSVYVAGVMVGVSSLTALIPLLTQIYQENYPETERGDLFSKAVMVRVLSMAFFAWGAGEWLESSMGAYRGLLLFFAVAAAAGAVWVARFPSTRLRESTSPHPLHGMRHIRKDAVFRWLLISWMFMGFGNLIMLPLRVEYLANPRFGITLSPSQIALLVSIIPSVVHLLVARMWGKLFDRMNFFVLRILLNAFFIAAILSFFVLGGMEGFVSGAVLFGVAMGGGNVAWSLWVTKVAKPNLVAEYMGVHTFLTGIRGLIAPFLGFYLIAFIPMTIMAWAAAGSILVASLILVPEARSVRRRRPGSPLAPKPGALQE